MLTTRERLKWPLLDVLRYVSSTWLARRNRFASAAETYRNARVMLARGCGRRHVHSYATVPPYIST